MKKLLALLLLFGIVGCSEKQTEFKYLCKGLEYHIKVNNIPKLIKDFNDDAIKSYQLNATGICNAQGIY